MAAVSVREAAAAVSPTGQPIGSFQWAREAFCYNTNSACNLRRSALS